MNRMLLQNGSIAGPVRRKKLHGREYIVAPITIMRPGIMAGNRGPLLYGGEENSRYTRHWNHIPLVIDHPQKGSARTADFLNERGIGFALDSKDLGGGVIQVDGYFDVAILKSDLAKHGRRILRGLERGDKLEVSTGLDGKIHNGEGRYDGQRYVGRVTDYVPDHIAVLTTKRGACGVVDGCGVNNAAGRPPGQRQYPPTTSRRRC